MCAPIVVAAVIVASGAYKAYTQYQEGKEQSKQYQYYASLADTKSVYEQQISEKKKNIVQDVAAEKSKEIKAAESIALGEQRAALAGQGVSGKTAADITADTFDKARLDEIALRYNADLNSYGIEAGTQGKLWELGEEKKQYTYASKYAKTTAKRQVLGTVLETAASVGMLYAGGMGGGSTSTLGKNAAPYNKVTNIKW